MAGKKRKWTRRSEAEAEPVVEAPPSLSPIEPSQGGAIEAVRSALAPFDASTRKRIVRAAEVMLR